MHFAPFDGPHRDRYAVLVASPLLPSREFPTMCLAIPGQIVDIVDESNRLAKVNVAGVNRTINIGLLDGDNSGVQPGEWVLIHVGFAMSKVDEEEAKATLDLLERMGEEYEQELEEFMGSGIQ
jgi:hydrogenase expression/formation protein HypC